MTGIPFRDQLWPEVPGPTRSYLALPNPARPRMLIDASSPLATRRVLRVVTVSGGARNRALASIAGQMSRLYLTTGRVRLPSGEGSLETHISHELGQRGLAFGWTFGPPRANRKPVVTIVGKSGNAAAYGKIAVNPLTRALLAHEAETITRLSGAVSGLQVPGCGPITEWQGLGVLLIEPVVPIHPGAALPEHLRMAAEDGIAAALGTRRMPLAESSFWQFTKTQIVVATHANPAWENGIRDTIREIEMRAGEVEVTLGSWHGDWTRHNVGYTERGASAWDWERFETGVPVGFDALHYWLTERLAATAASTDAAAELVTVAPEILSRYVASGAIRDPRLVALLYLMTIGTRYMTDRQDLAGSLASGFETWLLDSLPVLARTLDPRGDHA